MSDPLLDVKATCDALAAAYADALPGVVSAVHAWTLPGDAVAPFVLVQVRPGTGERMPFTRDAMADLHVITTSVGASLPQAIWLGDQVRQVTLERDSGAAFVTALDLSAADVAVLERDTDGAQVPDVVAGVPQVSDAFVLKLGRAA